MPTPFAPIGARPSDVHRAVLEVLNALCGVIYTTVCTVTNPTGKSEPGEAFNRLERLRHAITPFPEPRLYPDPFAQLNNGQFRLDFGSEILPVSQNLQPPMPVVGTSAHDATVRLARRVFDGLTVTKLYEYIDPKTGEKHLLGNFPYGYEREVVDIINGKPVKQKVTGIANAYEVEHYTSNSWSSDLWDRLFRENYNDLAPYGWSAFFNPQPGLLRLELEREAALVPDPLPFVHSLHKVPSTARQKQSELGTAASTVQFPEIVLAGHDRSHIDPRLPDDLAEALVVARNAASMADCIARLCPTSSHADEQLLALTCERARELIPGIVAVRAVLADLVPVSDPSRSFGKSCAHDAAIHRLTSVLQYVQPARGSSGCKVDSRLPFELSDTSDLIASCEREAYAAFASRLAVGVARRERIEGGPPERADPYSKLRQYARDELKGKERAVIEALCDADGRLPIADLAVMRGVDWDNSKAGFEGIQRRLRKELKKRGWDLNRRNNEAVLNPLKTREKAGD